MLESYPHLRSVIEQVCKAEGLPAEHTVFAYNATTGTNIAVNAIRPSLQQGDVVVTLSIAYGAVKNTIYTATQAAGAVVVEVPIRFPIPSPQAVTAALAGALADLHAAGRTVRAVVFDHISSSTGVLLPARELVRAVRSSAYGEDPIVVVDAAHAVGQTELFVDGADFYTTNLHKWAYTPRGTALLYVSPRMQAVTQPLGISHFFRSEFLRRFASEGTKDESCWAAAAAALAFSRAIGGRPAVAAFTVELRRRAEALLSGLWGTAGDVDCFVAPEEMRLSMALVKTPIADPQAVDVARVEDAKDVVLAAPSAASSASAASAAGPEPEAKQGTGQAFSPLPLRLRAKETPPHGGSALATKVYNALLHEHRILSPIICVNGHLYARISVQIFNNIGDYQRLGDAVVQIAAGLAKKPAEKEAA